MIVELINTGTELMLGRVLNTHQQWLCRQLADLGWVVSRQVAVSDSGEAIQAAVRESLSRADLVITTGGLGPTSDDITRELVAQLLGQRLVEDAAVKAHIAHRFALLCRPVPERTRLETQVPEGATVFMNAHGTAPGLAIKLSPNPFRAAAQCSWLIMLPGPPRELRPMFVDSIKPFLAEKFERDEPFVCRTVRSTGVGESIVEEKLVGPLQQLVAAGLEIGYCARPGEVDVRLVARNHQANELVSQADQIVRSVLSSNVFGSESDELEEVIIRLLVERNQTLAVAESCTGGAVANRLTNVPGASAVFRAGLVTYSNEAKQSFLGVRSETLSRHGAVSADVAREMAEGARERTGAAYALSLTGIAGPGGGSAEKPVGTVFIGLASPAGTEVIHRVNPWDRLTFKHVAGHQALDLLRRNLCSRP